MAEAEGRLVRFRIVKEQDPRRIRRGFFHAPSILSGRTIGTLLLLLIAFFAMGEGIPNPFILSPREILLFAALATMIFGQIAAFRWEGIGGVLILAGFVFFSVVNHRISINIVFGPWLLTGMISLGCWWMKRKSAGASSSPS